MDVAGNGAGCAAMAAAAALLPAFGYGCQVLHRLKTAGMIKVQSGRIKAVSVKALRLLNKHYV